MIVSRPMFTWVQDHLIRVWVKCHEYGYTSPASRSHGYGSETMGRGTNFRIRISVGMGMLPYHGRTK